MSLFLLGLLAGLGVAMPLGAIGVLLIREGVVAGFRTAAAGAGAVALVDSAYCVLAVTLGSVVAPSIEGLGATPQLLAGVVLIGIGVAGLATSGQTARAGSGPGPSGSPIRVFARFAGLTAINPATLIYFVALTTAVTTATGFPGNLVPFVLGVGVASALWQLGLVAIGTLLGNRLQPAGQRLLSVTGSLIVLALGVAALVSAIASA